MTRIVIAMSGGVDSSLSAALLVEAGYDVFAVEPRNQGDSERDPNYEPLQWVTDRDVSDMRAAVAYLKGRSDADPRGIGIFGISKGGSTGVLVASSDPWVRCVATDGMYGTHTTMVPYMQRWIQIYSGAHRIQRALPGWFYGMIGTVGVKKVARNRGVNYPSVEKAAGRLNRFGSLGDGDGEGLGPGLGDGLGLGDGDGDGLGDGLGVGVPPGITVTVVQPPGRFGAVDLDGDSARGFVEKPMGDGGWINAGFFVLSPAALEHIPDEDCMWEAQPVQSLASAGQLAAYRHGGFWMPMDTLRDKEKLEELWAGGKAPWKVWNG